MVRADCHEHAGAATKGIRGTPGGDFSPGLNLSGIPNWGWAVLDSTVTIGLGFAVWADWLWSAQATFKITLSIAFLRPSEISTGVQCRSDFSTVGCDKRVRNDPEG